LRKRIPKQPRYLYVKGSDKCKPLEAGKKRKKIWEIEGKRLPRDRALKNKKKTVKDESKLGAASEK